MQTPPRSILIVKPSSLGDIVHTLPAAAFIKRAWPQARLSWIAAPQWAPLLQGNPDIDEIIPFPRGELGRSPLSMLRWLKALGREHRADLVLDFQGLLRSAIMGRVCRGGTLIGLGDAREGARFFYDRSVPVGQEHAVDRYLKLAAALGIDTTGPLTWNLPEGTPPPGFRLDEPFVLLHPFSRGAGKSLTVEETARFAAALPCPVVLAGRADVRPRPGANVHLFLNRTTLPELIWLIRHARYVVSVDSGPMHIAAALTPRLLSLHTWSDPRLVGPYQPEAWVWKDCTLQQVKALRAQAASKPLTAPDLETLAAFVAEQIA